MKDLIVVIVSWNTESLTRDCLRSLFAEIQQLDDHDCEAWVVDNASTDGSVAMIRDEFPEVVLIQNEENLGFARANNQVLKNAEGRLYLLLNSDTVMPPGSLAALLATFTEYPQALAAGPKLILTDGSTQRSFWDLPTIASEFRYCLAYKFPPWESIFQRLFWRRLVDPDSLGAPHEVEALSMACLLVKGEAFAAVGYLPEDYFLFSEENDFFFRLRDLERPSYYVPGTSIHHFAGSSRKKRKTGDSQINFLRSRALFFRKYHPREFGRFLAIHGFFLRWCLLYTRLVGLVKRNRDPYHVELIHEQISVLKETGAS